MDTETTAPLGGVETRRAPDVMTRRAALEPRTFNAEARTVDLIWTTGADVRRRDFWTGETWIERLTVSDKAVDMARLNAGAPLLNTHSQWDLGDVIGVVERAWIEGGKGHATVRFSDRPEVAPILADVRAGILRNISVGYAVEAWRETEPTANAPRIREAVRWTPMEISLVPVPADAGAQVRAAPAHIPDPSGADDPPHPATRGAEPHTQETRMSDAANPGAPAPVETPVAPPVPAAASLDELRSIAGRAGLPAEWVLDRAAEGVTLDAARDAAIDAVAARQRTPEVRTPVAVLRDEKDVFLARASEALHARLTRAAPSEGAREFVNLGLHGMIREMAHRSGHRQAHRMTSDDIADFALRSHSSGDFANILANSANKAVGDMYGAYPNTWSSWCNEIDVPDFKTITAAFAGPFPELEEVPEGGPFTMGSIAEEAETYAVKERGRLIGLTRVAIVNDDTMAFERLLRNAALAGYSTLRRVVFGILTTNAAMADTVALFNAAHNNLGSAGNLSATTLKELRGLLTKQTSPIRSGSGEATQSLPPPTQLALIVGPDEEDTAMELLGNRIVPNAVDVVLPDAYRSQMTLVMEPYLDTGNDPYYLARRDIQAMQIAYLSGRRAPSVTSAETIGHSGITYRCTFDFGAKAVTWRTIAANLG